MAKHVQEDHDPFEPGVSTPEFNQYARENYAAHARKGGKRSGNSAVPAGTSRAPRRSHAAPAPAGGAPYRQAYGRTIDMPSSASPESRASRAARTLKGILVCIVCAALLETFGFNFQFFSSMTYPQVGSYLVNGVAAGSEGALTLTSQGNSFEITGLDDTVKSIHFTPTLANSTAAKAATDGKVQVVMSLTDEGNANYYSLPAVSVDPSDPASCYIALEPAGKAHSIKVAFTNLADVGQVGVTGIGLNERVPFDLEPLRFLTVLAILLVLYALRPQSSLFSHVLQRASTRRVALIAVLVSVEAVAVFALAASNTHFVSMTHTATTENYFQYQKLAEALLQGHFYLNDQPSSALMAMTNPYDTAARAAQGVPFLWDHAYFQGKYYVYFGILPCLVFYVPWLAVTGTGFPTWVGVAVCDAAFAAGIAYLLARVCDRWFPRTSVGLFVAVDVMLFIAGGGLILARTPSMYFLPEAMGLALIAWGLGLWVSGTSRGFIERGKIVAGAALIALTMAARPQMVLAAVIGLALFVPFLKKARAEGGSTGAVWGAFRAAIVPFLVVGLLVLAYNAARFGSPFDFGANYNLTTNDMTHRGFHADRIPFGLYAYLFQPPVLGSQFPFLRQAYLDPAYQGITIYEPMYGGYFFLYPMAIAVLGIVRARTQLAQKGATPLFWCCIALGFVLCIFDLQGAGILMRYICDFGLYFALAAAFVFLELLQAKSDRPLDKGWTQAIGGQGVQAVPAYAGAAPADTVSVYRIALYFLCATLLLMVVVAVLLWNAFGMY